MGLLQAILEAIHGEDDRLAGQTVTRLRASLTATNTTSAEVESAIGFGNYTDGTTTARFAINGEIIEASSRSYAPNAHSFLALTRGVDGTTAKAHPAGSLVYDVSFNRTAYDLVRRGFFVRTARTTDLDVIGRNLGLHKCDGLSEEQWRRIIKAVAYLPKQPVDAFRKILEAYYDNTTDFEVWERLVTNRWTVFIRINPNFVTGAEQIRGRFVLTGGTERLTTGLTSVTTPYPIRTVAGVYDATTASRRGLRDGLTNYFSGGSFVAGTSLITLGSSPGAVGTSVLVDYTAYGSDDTISYHYLADDETIDDDGDRYAYLSGPFATIQCLLDQVRPVGVKIDLGFVL